MKFGDIIINPYASKGNPHRKAVFVRDCGKSIELTDMSGTFWRTYKPGKGEKQFKIDDSILKREGIESWGYSHREELGRDD